MLPAKAVTLGMKGAATFIVAAVIAACGGSGSGNGISAGSAINNGVIPIANAATYSWTFTSGSCFTGPAGPGFRLISDSGTVDPLVGHSGTVYLSPGNWTGEAGEETTGTVGYTDGFGHYHAPTPPTFQPVACNWSLMLSPK